MTAPVGPNVAGGPQAAVGGPPQAPQPLPPPQRPWTPFDPRPNDSEPLIAQKWMTRLSKVISTVKYSAATPEWRQVLDEAYTTARAAVAAAQPAPALPKGVTIQGKPQDAGSLGAEENAAQHPDKPQQQAGTQPTQRTQPTQSALTSPVGR